MPPRLLVRVRDYEYYQRHFPWNFPFLVSLYVSDLANVTKSTVLPEALWYDEYEYSYYVVAKFYSTRTRSVERKYSKRKSKLLETGGYPLLYSLLEFPARKLVKIGRKYEYS